MENTMTDTADLIRRLRANANEEWMTIGAKPFAVEAAAVIEQQAARIKELEGAAGLAITALSFLQERAVNERDGVAFLQISTAKNALVGSRAAGGEQ